MKKILSVFTCLLLLVMLATPVFAAQTATMTVKASKTELKPGDKVTFTVSVSKVQNCTIGGFLYSFDESVFTYDSGKSLAGLKGFFAGVSTAANKIAGFFMNGKSTIEGDLFSVTLKVRDDAKAGTYTVTGKPSLTVSSGKVDCTAVGAQVTVNAGGSPSDKTTPTQPSVPVPTQPVTDAAGENLVEDIVPGADKTPISDDAPGNVIQTVTENQALVLDEDAPQKPAFPWWILVIVVLVAAGGTVFLIIEIKKTKKTS